MEVCCSVYKKLVGRIHEKLSNFIRNISKVYFNAEISIQIP